LELLEKGMWETKRRWLDEVNKNERKIGIRR
jgi:hypothetical protein